MTDVIRFVCATCGKRLKAPSKAVGQQVACPGCQSRMVIPQPPLVEEDDSGEFYPEPRRPSRAAEPSPRRSPFDPPAAVDPAPASTGDPLAFPGYLCAAVSLLLFPPFFGLIGVVIGIVMLGRGRSNHGLGVLVTSILCMMLGMILGAIAVS